MSKQKFLIICALLLWMAIPVLAHSEDSPVSDTEKLVSGIGALILALSMLSLLFKKKGNAEPPE